MLVTPKFESDEFYKITYDKNVIRIGSVKDPSLTEITMEVLGDGIVSAHSLTTWMKCCKCDHEEVWNRYGFYDRNGNRPPEELPMSEIVTLDFSVNEYGSADSVEQILEHGVRLAQDKERRFVVQVFAISKEHDGGYRWHKNGPYIGNKERSCEYLADEKDINQIVQFSFIELKKLKNA